MSRGLTSCIFEKEGKEEEARRVYNVKYEAAKALGQIKGKEVENWQAEIWQDILKVHYGKINEADIEEKYADFYAISQLTVSTSHTLKRFKKLNKGKPWKEQIKPFNFCLVGFQADKDDGKAVKPLAPFTKDFQEIVDEHFSTM